MFLFFCLLYLVHAVYIASIEAFPFALVFIYGCSLAAKIFAMYTLCLTFFIYVNDINGQYVYVTIGASGVMFMVLLQACTAIDSAHGMDSSHSSLIGTCCPIQF